MGQLQLVVAALQRPEGEEEEEDTCWQDTLSGGAVAGSGLAVLAAGSAAGCSWPTAAGFGCWFG